MTRDAQQKNLCMGTAETTTMRTRYVSTNCIYCGRMVVRLRYVLYLDKCVRVYIE